MLVLPAAHAVEGAFVCTVQGPLRLLPPPVVEQAEEEVPLPVAAGATEVADVASAGDVGSTADVAATMLVAKVEALGAVKKTPPGPDALALEPDSDLEPES